MKSCGYEEMAHLYPAGALTPAEKKDFERHVTTCKTCDAIAREVATIRGMATVLATESPRAGFNERIMNGIRRREAREAPQAQWIFIQRWQKALAPTALAACLLLSVGVFHTPPHAGVQHSAQTQKPALGERATPSEYLGKYALSADEQRYLSGSSDDALSSHLDSILKTN